METTLQNGELAYVETPHQCDAPVKIDKILEERMRVFMKARRVRRFTFMK